MIRHFHTSYKYNEKLILDGEIFYAPLNGNYDQIYVVPYIILVYNPSM